MVAGSGALDVVGDAIDPLKITIVHHEHKVTVEDQAVNDITDALDLIELALVQIGYQPQRIKAAYRFKAEQDD